MKQNSVMNTRTSRFGVTCVICLMCSLLFYYSWMPSSGQGMPIDEQMSYSRPGTSHRITDILRGAFLNFKNTRKNKKMGSLTQSLMDVNNLPGDYNGLFQQMVSLENRGWIRNDTIIQQFRDELRDYSEQDDLRNQIITTQDSRKPGQYINSMKSFGSVKVTDELWQMFANHSIFDGPRLKRCNIVGSGGILLNSKCGSKIDDGDLVFRFNLPTIKNFSADVGTKSSFVTVNPSAVRNWLNGIFVENSGLKALEEISLEHRGHALLSAFDVNFNLKYAIQMYQIRQEQPCEETYFINPDHLLTFRNFWSNAGMDQEISSGFYIASAAIDICEEVHIYGFWPFTVSTRGVHVPYHYYDKAATALYHDLTLEYRVLIRMHEMGLIKLQLGPCKTS